MMHRFSSERADEIALNAAALRRDASSSIVLASQTVHVTTDANARPTITACTTMSADRNMPHGERSCGSMALAVTAASEAGADCARAADETIVMADASETPRKAFKV